MTEYQYVGIFMVIFAVLIFVFLGSVESFSTSSKVCTYDTTKMCKPALMTAVFSTVSFILGAVTSVISGFLGMKIATYANARTTLEARKGVGKAFIVAFRSGAVMGFLLAANGLLVLYITINLFKIYYGDDWEGLFESITGYGLGGSSMALFGRVGGGIYTKAADVGADLVGKVERNIPEDDPRNPAVKSLLSKSTFMRLGDTVIVLIVLCLVCIGLTLMLIRQKLQSFVPSKKWCSRSLMRKSLHPHHEQRL